MHEVPEGEAVGRVDWDLLGLYHSRVTLSTGSTGLNVQEVSWQIQCQIKQHVANCIQCYVKILK